MNKWNGTRAYTQSTTGGTSRIKSTTTGHYRQQSYIRCEDNVPSGNPRPKYEPILYPLTTLDINNSNVYNPGHIQRPTKRVNVPDIRAIHRPEVNYRPSGHSSPQPSTAHNFHRGIVDEFGCSPTPSSVRRTVSKSGKQRMSAQNTVSVSVPACSNDVVEGYHLSQEPYSNDVNNYHYEDDIILGARGAYVTFEQHTDELTKAYDRGFHDGLLEGIRRQKMSLLIPYGKDLVCRSCCSHSHCPHNVKKKRHRTRSNRTKSKASKESINGKSSIDKDSEKSQYYSDYNSIGRTDSGSNHRRRYRSKSVDRSPEVRSKVLGLVDDVLNTIEYLDNAATVHKERNGQCSVTNGSISSINRTMSEDDEQESLPSIPLLNISNVGDSSWLSGKQTQGLTYFD